MACHWFWCSREQKNTPSLLPVISDGLRFSGVLQIAQATAFGVLAVTVVAFVTGFAAYCSWCLREQKNTPDLFFATSEGLR